MFSSVARKEIADVLCKIIWEQLTGRKYRRLRFCADLVCFDRNGKLKWIEKGPNALVDGGEEYFIKTGITEQISVPSYFSLGLSQSNESTLGETVTLGGINEVTGTGYARQNINSDATDWTASLDSGDWQAQSKIVTFTATGTWTAALSMFLTDGTRVMCTKDLSTSRTLYDGDQLQARITVKMT